MRHWRACFALLALVLPVTAVAQTTTFLRSPAPISMVFSATEPSAGPLHLHPFSKDYLKSYAQDGWGLLKAPVQWKGSDWSKLALSGALVTAAWYVDRDLQQFAERNVRWAAVLNYTDPIGNGLVTIPVAGVIWLEGRYRDNQHTQLVGLNVAKAFILSRAMVQLPKYIFQRQRPLESGNNPGLFDGPFGRYQHTSFPSGHVTSAFAAAAVFRQAYGEEHRWVPITFYTLAVATGAGRMIQGKHWFSDVVAGALLGQVVGDYISKKGVTRFEIAGNGVVLRF
jgi:membrane-associated phospholipid phosphatase